MWERMLEKQVIPTRLDVEEHCGKMREEFILLQAFLSDTYGTIQEIRFPYGNSYGWCITHRKKKQLICDVFVEKDAFTIMLRLSNAQFEKQYQMVSKDTQHIIDQKYPCGNGG